MKKYLPAIGAIIFTGLLWGLQMIPNPDSKSFVNETYVFSDKFIKSVWDYKFIIGLIFVLLSIIINVLNIYFQHRNDRKIWLKQYMKHIIKEEFSGEFARTRITIFKTNSGFRYTFPYLVRSYIKCFKSHKEDGLLGVHWKNKPKWSRSYLTMHIRCSTPHEGGSSTCFPIPRDINEVFGIASRCYYSKKTERIETFNISSIVSPNKKFADYTDGEKEKIIKYAKANHMYINGDMDKTYGKLRCIHRLSNHLYAELIYDKNEEIWGVFVVDIDTDNDNEVFNPKLRQIMSKTVRVMSLSLNHIK